MTVVTRDGQFWDIYGLPYQYFFTDGGKDFNSKHLKAIGKKLDFQCELRDRLPEGGIVERLFKTINTQVLKDLPGYTAGLFHSLKQVKWQVLRGIKIMGAALIEQLKQVEDLRTTDGRRHPLWLVLLFVIMGTMNGYMGYRGCSRFCQTASSSINREI
ncbi:transposase family protein [Halotia branconii]|uniref:Transposase family protein n=1 Tax=Halotia branconii CENA392 TaxID=1539056 RepID=A0AAJ6NRJ0_9CYAN|nr:transposase family protein [Halotia branconii]WGV25277.1 transposase family protein [Halotia branconii CENA392]